MIIFDDIILRLKEIIATDQNQNKIYNKDVARALDLTPQYFAVIKKRGKIPYEAIALFCKKHHISINWILFEQEPKLLSS